MRSCIWKKIRADLDIKSNNYCFLGQKSVKDDELIQAVHDGRFFGILKIDIFSPDEVINKLGHLNFPVIFRFAICCILLEN